MQETGQVSSTIPQGTTANGIQSIQAAATGLPPGAIVVNPTYIPHFYPNLIQGKKQISRHKFSQEEDDLLRKLVNEHGTTNWRFIAESIPGRSARQCRDRWKNYLMPGIAKGPWSPEEDALLEEKYKEMGPQWSRIAKFFPNRTDINIKNRWATRGGRMNRAQPINQPGIGQAQPISIAQVPENASDATSNNTTLLSRFSQVENAENQQNEGINGNENVNINNNAITEDTQQNSEQPVADESQQEQPQHEQQQQQTTGGD